MANLSRDVPFFHRMRDEGKSCTTSYCQNIRSLVVTIDDMPVDTRLVRDLYQSPYNPAQYKGGMYAHLFVTDDNNQIVIGDDGNPEVHKVEGKITIIGEPSYCDCWVTRLVDQWWVYW